MAKFSTIQNNFTAGEIDKKLDGRVDLANYKNGVDSIENMLPQYYGGATKRSGTQHIVGSTNFRTIPYVYSSKDGGIENYIITFKTGINAVGPVIDQTQNVKVYKTDGTGPLTTLLRGTQSSNVFLDTFLTVTVSRVYDFDYAQVGNILFLADKTGEVQPLAMYINANGNFEVTPFLDPFASASFVFQQADVSVANDTITEFAHQFRTGDLVYLQLQSGATVLPAPLAVLTPYYVIDDSSSTIKLATTEANALAGVAIDITTVGTEGGGNFFIYGVSAYDYIGSGVNPVLRVPFGPTNIDPNKYLKASATAEQATITLTAYLDSAGTITNDDFFSSDSTGKYYRLTHGGQEGTVLVTSYVSGSQVNGYVMPSFLSKAGTLDLGATTPTDVWKESLWDGVNGFPKSVTAHEDRIFWGGTPKEPDHVWASQKENFFIMTGDRYIQDEGVTADQTGLRFFGEELAIDSFGFFLVNKDINEIKWMYGGRSLLVGTSNGEFVVDGGNEIMSRTNPPFIKNISRVGSSSVKPAPFGNGVIFVAKDGRRMREFAYSDENGSYVSKDISLLAPDIASYKTTDIGLDWYDSDVIEITYDSNRHIVWAVTTVGTLISITYNKEAGVAAWAKHVIGGQYSGVVPYYAGTVSSFTIQLGFVPVLSVCTLPGDSSVYSIVLRDFNGAVPAESVQLEKIGLEFENPDLTSETEPAFFSDGALISTVIDSSTSTYNFEIRDSDVTVGTDNFNEVAHGLSTLDKVTIFLSDPAGTLPAPLVADTEYFAIIVDADNFKLAATEADALAGTPIDITTIGNDASGRFRFNITGRKVFPEYVHLSGQPVSILADGLVITGKSVDASGVLTLDTHVETMVAGCPYTSELITKNIHAGQNYETALGAIKRLDRVIARFYKTYHAEINTQDPSDVTKYEEIEFLNPNAGMGSPLVLFSGEKNVYAKSDPDREIRVGIRSTKPLPMTVTALVMRGQTYE